MATAPKAPRRSPRIGVPQGMTVEGQAGGSHEIARVATLGLGGLFIDVENPRPLGDVIQLFFRVPDGDARARAIVRDSHPGKGMGVEFTYMASDRSEEHT